MLKLKIITQLLQMTKEMLLMQQLNNCLKKSVFTTQITQKLYHDLIYYVNVIVLSIILVSCKNSSSNNLENNAKNDAFEKATITGTSCGEILYAKSSLHDTQKDCYIVIKNKISLLNEKPVDFHSQKEDSLISIEVYDKNKVYTLNYCTDVKIVNLQLPKVYNSRDCKFSTFKKNDFVYVVIYDGLFITKDKLDTIRVENTFLKAKMDTNIAG